MAMCVFLALQWKVRVLSVDPLVSGCKSHPSLTPPHFTGGARVDCTSCPQAEEEDRTGEEWKLKLHRDFCIVQLNPGLKHKDTQDHTFLYVLSIICRVC